MKRTIEASDNGELPASKRKTATSDPTFTLNERVLCKFNDGLFYEAKIIRLSSEKGRNGYEIHYQGWNKRYDEIVAEDEAKDRFKKFDPDEAKQALTAQKRARNSVSISKPPEKTPKSTTKPSKTVAKVTPTLPEKKAKVKQENEDVKPAIAIPSQLGNLITEDLAFVLCEENENVTKQQKLPKVPAKLCVEDIVKQFLQSKGATIDHEFTDALENYENIVPSSIKVPTAMAFFLNLFDYSFSRVLSYKEEKSSLETFFKDSSNQAIIRYSKSLGFTHLLRFIARFSEILEKCAPLDPNFLKFLSSLLKDFCIFLEPKIGDLYPDDYYELTEH